MGLPGCRQKSVSYCFIAAFTAGSTTLIELIPRIPVRLNVPPCLLELVLRAVRFLQLAHFQERHQKGQGGFCSLIFIGAVGVQTVSTSAGSGVIECDLQIVVSQEPIECGPSFFAPAALSGCAISLQACGDDRAGFDGLLVEAGLLGRLGIEALRADRHEMTFYFATLQGDEPIQGFESRRNHFFVPGAYTRSHQSLGQTGVRIGEAILKPFPIIGAVGAIGIQQSIRQSIGSTESGAISGKGVEILLEAEQGKSAGARALEFDSGGNGKFKHTARGSTQSRVFGSAENGPQSPKSPPVAVFRALRLLPVAFVTQTVSEPFRGGVKSKPEECQIPGGQEGGAFWRARSEGVQKNRDDQGAGVIVRRVAFGIVRNRENGVLDQSRRVGHAKQMIEFYGGKAIEILFGVLGCESGARTP